MRDCCNNISAQLLPQDIIYKDVVIIGNGPSGISLSALLSGIWPYYNGKPHPDEMLTARLQSLSNEQSLIEQDLQFLSQGLVGRSNNPISVLADNLSHPYDDQNMNNSGETLINWKYHTDKMVVDHVVLGKGKPGGSWQNMHGDLLTVSVSSWMQLPGLAYEEWACTQSHLIKNANDNVVTNNTNTEKRRKEFYRRVLVKDIAKYYPDYVDRMRLTKNFHNFTYVTSVKKIKNLTQYLSDLKQAENFLDENGSVISGYPEWEIDCFDTSNCCRYKYICRNVVLACGTFDNYKTLNIPGELSNPEWVFHNLKDFTSAVDNLSYHDTKKNIDPILVVGSGLSAADYVLVGTHHKLPIIHVFSTCSLLDNRILPKNTYPEYNKVCRMMKGEKRKLKSSYQPLCQHMIAEINDDKTVRIMSPDGQSVYYKISFVVVAVGCSPDLCFLPAEFSNGKTLGVQKNQPIDCRQNPLFINPWTYEVVNAYNGMYAMGPIVGDHLIRLLIGGAFAITKHIYEKRRRKR